MRGQYIECDRCGQSFVYARNGKGSINECTEEGWGFRDDSLNVTTGHDLCPQCFIKYKSLINYFNTKLDNFFNDVHSNIVFNTEGE